MFGLPNDFMIYFQAGADPGGRLGRSPP